jgi:hypothetical protein
MTLDEFKDAIDRWGSAVETWPAQARNAAQALLASQPAATKLLEAASRFDQLFAMEDLPPPPAVATILSRATVQRPSLLARLLRVLELDVMGSSWLPAGGLAACLAVGVIMGAAMPRRDAVPAGLLDFAVGGRVGPSAQMDAGDE